MKFIALIFIIVWITGCGFNAIDRLEQVPLSENSTPTVIPTPFSFPVLSETEQRTLDEHLPPKVREVFEKAETIELIELGKLCYQAFSPKLTSVRDKN